MVERKQTQLMDIKILDAEQGIVEALVNSMGVKDTDNDILAPESFNETIDSIRDGFPVTVLLGHDPSKVVGKVIDAAPIRYGDSMKLYNKIQFNMDTQLGRETFSNVAGEYISQYSVGFNIKENGSRYVQLDDEPVRVIDAVDWVETSVVLRGASPNTGTLSAKSDEEKGAIAYRETPTTDVPWDGPATQAEIPNDAGAEVLRRYYAYVDDDGDQDAKSSYKFIHHDYPSGAANLRACSNGIGVLNGGRGGTTIPESSIDGVYQHLRSHIESASEEAPPLERSDDDEERRRRRYSADSHHNKANPELRDGFAATDDAPPGEAWMPVTDETRAQVLEAEDFRRRLLGIRVQINRVKQRLTNEGKTQ